MKPNETHGEVAFAADVSHVAVAIADVTYSGRHNLIPGLIGQWIEAEIALSRFNRRRAAETADAREWVAMDALKLQLGHAMSEMLTETGAVDGLKLDFHDDPNEAAVRISWNGCRGNMADGSLAIAVVLTGGASPTKRTRSA
ncbi:MAG: hypothetical protein EPN36_03620 [Rhodanobacteraceae bacterium]|nr:MAG: hypothetical protein EPN36_03620 [Rhodanobacteraceae bacterium]